MGDSHEDEEQVPDPDRQRFATPRKLHQAASMKIMEFIDETNQTAAALPLLVSLEKKTGISKGKIALGLLVLTFGVIFFGFGSKVLIHVIGTFFPVFWSFRLLEHSTNADEFFLWLQYWLQYWVFFSMFQFVERPLDFLLSWIPGYSMAKFALLFYCFLTEMQGASRVYEFTIQSWMSDAYPYMEAGYSLIINAFYDFVDIASHKILGTPAKLVLTRQLSTPSPALAPQLFPPALSVRGRGNSGASSSSAAAASSSTYPIHLD